MPATESSVAIFSRASQMLAEADTIQKTKELKDLALVAADWAKRKGMGEEAVRYARSYALEAERKMGQLLAETERAKGGQPYQATGHALLPVEPTLAALGLTKRESSDAQRLATLPTETFEAIKSGDKTLVQAYREIKRDTANPPPPLPSGLFDVILADPPWRYDNQIESWGPTSLHYPDMSLEEICQVIVPSADNAALFLWATNPMLRDAFAVIDAWSFAYKTNMVWVKTELQRPGSGFYVRGRHELLLICTKGSFVPDQTGKEPIGSVIEAPVREHSRKPDSIYGIIERIYPEKKYLELFARRPEKRQAWTYWGNQIETS